MSLRADPRPRGFTLIELVVVMAIIVMLAAISYPMLERWTDDAIRKGARQLTAAIERSYEQAVTTRQLFRLRVETGGQGYWIDVLDEEGKFVQVGGERRLPGDVRVRDVMVTAGGVERAIAEGEVAIYFYPIGRTDPAIIHLALSAGGPTTELSLTPHPLTGRVTVTDGYLTFES